MNKVSIGLCLVLALVVVNTADARIVGSSRIRVGSLKG